MEDKYKVNEIFGHVRQTRCDSKSTILVENLLLENKDIFAVAILDDYIREPDFHRYKAECRYDEKAADILDRRRVAYAFCCNVDNLQKESAGFHCGDCTCIAFSCSRCIAESHYVSGLESLDEWNTFLINNNIVCLNPCIKLLEILFGSEHLWVDCNELFKLTAEQNRLKSIPGCFDPTINQRREELWDNLWDLPWRYNYWNNLSLEEKEYCHKRAVRFRDYFDNRPTVEGIPWW